VKLAIITPTKYLKEFIRISSNNYYMVLAQRYFVNKEYRDYYRRLSTQEGNVIILDNGACELKKSIDSRKLFEIATDLRPDVLIAPDVLLSSSETKELTNEFLKNYYEELNSMGIELMAVIQGKSHKEWFECFNEFNENRRIRYIGISNTNGVFSSEKFPRIKVLQEIEKNGLLYSNKKVHILGLGDSGHIELEKFLKFDFIEGCDTGAPITHGASGVVFKKGVHYKKIKKYLPDDVLLSEKQIEDIKKNINFLYSILE
jgi:hypothetical protein